MVQTVKASPLWNAIFKDHLLYVIKEKSAEKGGFKLFFNTKDVEDRLCLPKKKSVIASCMEHK